GAAVEDVEAPYLSAHIGRVDAVGEAIAVEVDDLDVGRHRVTHVGERACRVRRAAVPQQRTGDGVDDIEPGSRLVRARVVVVLRLVVAAGEDHHRARTAVDVDLRRYRRGPGLAEARERRAVETPQELRSPRVRDV